MNAEWMHLAVRLARENVASGRGGPFGAVVVKAEALVASGTNLVTSMNDPTAHAEVVAIRAACQVLGAFQLTGCEVYTSCEPCPMCLGALYWARPERIFYAATHTDAAAAGFDDSFIYRQTRLSPAERSLPMVRMLDLDALAPFEEWASRQDRIPY